MVDAGDPPPEFILRQGCTTSRSNVSKRFAIAQLIAAGRLSTASTRLTCTGVSIWQRESDASGESTVRYETASAESLERQARPLSAVGAGAPPQPASARRAAPSPAANQPRCRIRNSSPRPPFLLVTDRGVGSSRPPGARAAAQGKPYFL